MHTILEERDRWPFTLHLLVSSLQDLAASFKVHFIPILVASYRDLIISTDRNDPVLQIWCWSTCTCSS